MTACLNKVELIGHVGTNAEMKHTQNGNTPMCTFRLATNEQSRNKAGDKVQRTEWHNIILWGKMATIYQEHINKGRYIYLEGRIQTRKYNDEDGNNRFYTEIVAKNILFLQDRKSASLSSSDSTEDEFDYAEDDLELEDAKSEVSY